MSWDDGGTEAEYLTSQGSAEHYDGKYFPKINRNRGRKRIDNTNRYRCCATGCNPIMFGEEQAHQHTTETGHRTAKWPVRSAEGKRKARIRNKTGYYDKYNVGEKSYIEREHLI